MMKRKMIRFTKMKRRTYIKNEGKGRKNTFINKKRRKLVNEGERQHEGEKCE